MLSNVEFNRRTLLSLAAVATVRSLFPASALQAAEVDWLADVQRPPTRFELPDPPLTPLLVSADGSPITTREAWLVRRAQILKDWLDFLGPMPKRPPVKLEVLKEDRDTGCLRQLVRYECEPGQFVEGYLLRPPANAPGIDARGLRAGIVAQHGTSTANITEIAGLGGPEYRHVGLRLAKLGFVVFCPRCFLWQDVKNYKEAVANFKHRHPKTLGMHKMLYDAQRGVDVLTSLPDEVDPQRLGTCGHSLGAKETLYLMAFDERVRAGVFSEGGIGLKSTNWNAPWYLGTSINAPGFRLNHHELLALIAPRAFLVLAGESGRGSADGDRSWPYLAAALPVYRLYTPTARLGLFNHHQGHSLPEEAQTHLQQWLQTYLGE